MRVSRVVCRSARTHGSADTFQQHVCRAGSRRQQMARPPETDDTNKKNKVAYVVNCKAQGKVHLVVALNCSRQEHRVRCGWHILKSRSRVYNCRKLKWGELCRKCFPASTGADDFVKPSETEPIEECAP